MPLPLDLLRNRTLITDRTADTALVRATGSERCVFLSRVMSGDLPASGCAPTALLGPRGNLRAVGHAVVLPDRVDIECDASAARGLRDALDRYRITDDVALRVAAGRVTRIEGRDALAVLRGSAPIGDDPEFRLAPIPGGFVRRETRPWPSFLMVGEPADGDPWQRLLDGGAVPASPEEAHWLRIAAGEPRWGSEADEQSLPLQSGFRAHVRIGKGCYIGQEYVARQAHRGRVTRELIGLAFEGRPGTPTRPGAAVEHGDHPVGKLTSAASLPEGTIGMAVVTTGIAPGTRVRIGACAAAVAPLPLPLSNSDHAPG